MFDNHYFNKNERLALKVVIELFAIMGQEMEIGFIGTRFGYSADQYCLVVADYDPDHQAVCGVSSKQSVRVYCVENEKESIPTAAEYHWDILVPGFTEEEKCVLKCTAYFKVIDKGDNIKFRPAYKRIEHAGILKDWETEKFKVSKK
ncbi:TPA: hypothetical protein DD449_03940 [Candidatus Berkelbacteria bacterium]|uniref:Uncharacterized protein n=1 Tax=Berkelbacteria bacterium GW2011_GWE1_39_12 TaxID=1618337 RepID=A0A0G4B3W5_9BACT|nr:MAG: hypothetical protein UT28_C0001G0424 [Berkelbacteria bacterium GW2011_GWE1_39_12]HBO60808.1 hypothetical protein [Candidatus Berkelbacteria bacterium]